MEIIAGNNTNVNAFQLVVHMRIIILYYVDLEAPKSIWHPLEYSIWRSETDNIIVCVVYVIFYVTFNRHIVWRRAHA